MIEEALQDDLEAVYGLICELEQDQINKQRFEQLYLQQLQNPDIFYYVYRVDKNVVGFISLYVHHYLHHHRDTGEIVELVVLPQYRSMKIGEQLLKHVEQKARELDLEEIELSTSTYRKKAQHFYEAHGYVKDHYNYTKDL